MGKGIENKLHVSLAEVGAYQYGPKRMPGGRPFNPEEFLDPTRRAAGRALRRVQSSEAKKVAEKAIALIKQKR